MLALVLKSKAYHLVGFVFETSSASAVKGYKPTQASLLIGSFPTGMLMSAYAFGKAMRDAMNEFSPNSAKAMVRRGLLLRTVSKVVVLSEIVELYPEDGGVTTAVVLVEDVDFEVVFVDIVVARGSKVILLGGLSRSLEVLKNSQIRVEVSSNEP